MKKSMSEDFPANVLQQICPGVHGIAQQTAPALKGIIFYRHAILTAKAHITVRQWQEDQPGVRSFVDYTVKQTREFFIFLAGIVCYI